MTTLLLDIGNTRTKYVIMENNQIISHNVLEKSFNAASLIELVKPDKIGISSVNKTAFEELIKSIPPQLKSELFIIDSGIKLNYKMGYHTPESLGSDRICSVAGAVALNKGKNAFLIVIDSGTCITLNIIFNGVFIGGFIAPGIDTMLHAMHEFTGNLPKLEKYHFEENLGKNTKDSMMGGVILFLKGINGYIKSMGKELGHTPKLYLTGGNGKFLIEYLRGKVVFNEHLVALGIKELMDIN